MDWLNKRRAPRKRWDIQVRNAMRKPCGLRFRENNQHEKRPLFIAVGKPHILLCSRSFEEIRPPQSNAPVQAFGQLRERGQGHFAHRSDPPGAFADQQYLGSPTTGVPLPAVPGSIKRLHKQ
jgi:hypothetical protein